jgi:hypothetical protein
MASLVERDEKNQEIKHGLTPESILLTALDYIKQIGLDSIPAGKVAYNLVNKIMDELIVCDVFPTRKSQKLCAVIKLTIVTYLMYYLFILATSRRQWLTKLDNEQKIQRQYIYDKVTASLKKFKNAIASDFETASYVNQAISILDAIEGSLNMGQQAISMLFNMELNTNNIYKLLETNLDIYIENKPKPLITRVTEGATQAGNKILQFAVDYIPYIKKVRDIIRSEMDAIDKSNEPAITKIATDVITTNPEADKLSNEQSTDYIGMFYSVAQLAAPKWTVKVLSDYLPGIVDQLHLPIDRPPRELMFKAHVEALDPSYNQVNFPFHLKNLLTEVNTTIAEGYSNFETSKTLSTKEYIYNMNSDTLTSINYLVLVIFIVSFLYNRFFKKKPKRRPAIELFESSRFDIEPFE